MGQVDGLVNEWVNTKTHQQQSTQLHTHRILPRTFLQRPVQGHVFERQSVPRRAAEYDFVERRPERVAAAVRAEAADAWGEAEAHCPCRVVRDIDLKGRLLAQPVVAATHGEKGGRRLGLPEQADQQKHCKDGSRGGGP